MHTPSALRQTAFLRGERRKRGLFPEHLHLFLRAIYGKITFTNILEA